MNYMVLIIVHVFKGFKAKFVIKVTFCSFLFIKKRYTIKIILNRDKKRC